MTQRCVICNRGETAPTYNPLAPEFRWIRRVPCVPCGGEHRVCLVCRRVLGFEGEYEYEAELCLDSDEIRVMLELQGHRP